jgi:hypothetical protein
MKVSLIFLLTKHILALWLIEVEETKGKNFRSEKSHGFVPEFIPQVSDVMERI